MKSAYLSARKTVCLVSLLAGMTLAAPLWAAAYTVTNLGTLGGAYSTPWGINESGQVVGFSRYLRGNSASHAFLWSNGTMTDLGTLGGESSFAYGINDRGQVVGTSRTAAGDVRAFLWSNGAMTDLGILSEARGINNSGQVAGTSGHAFLWSNGTMTDLGTLGGQSSRAWDINESGQVVGEDITRGFVHRPFLWSNGSMTDLGTLGGNFTIAHSINDSGQVVGQSELPGGVDHAFLWSNGTMTDLDTLGGGSRAGSRAWDINESGQVVGRIGYRAVLWSNGEITDLNSLIDPASGWALEEALAINDRGQIVGIGGINGQGNRAYLLTPVPEADSYAYMAIGLGLVGWMARRRKAARCADYRGSKAA